jgi:hypothetical protein
VNCLELTNKPNRKISENYSLFMKRDHPDPAHRLDMRQLLEQMLAENIKWGKFGSITGNALAEKQILKTALLN